MIGVATARINSFAPVAQQADVQHSEEPIFVLSSSQLQEIITRAIQPLQDEVQVLKNTIALQGEKIVALESTQDIHAENDLNQLRLINDLRKDHEPQPLQKDRAEILRALLAANNGKMLAKEARQKMRLDEATFSRLIEALGEFIEKKPYRLDRRQSLLIIK